MSFEHVWQQILEIARTRKELRTLGRRGQWMGVRNKIVSVSENAIVVMSETTNRARKLTKSTFRRVWNALTIHRQITCRRDEEVLVPHQRIVMAFLAHLPNVEYSYRPQTLHLVPYDTHPLGKKREHMKEKQAFGSSRSLFSCEGLTEAFKKAIEEYGEDENVLHYISKGIKERGYLTPMDLFYIACWKAPSNDRSRGRLANLAFECIRSRGVEGIKTVTKEAIELSEREEIEKSIVKLTELQGVGTRVASAILTFYDPKKFGAVDWKAWKTLYDETKKDFEPKDYVKYLKDIRELAQKCNITPRNVDLALWYLG